MVETKIKNVYDVFYVSKEEIATAINAKEILTEYSGTEKIPVRVLELTENFENHYCIILAGEGALYPWKRGQKVATSYINSMIDHWRFLRDLCVKGIDNSKYQTIHLYDTIIPIKPGNYFPEKDDKKYKGLVSHELYQEIADMIISKYY